MNCPRCQATLQSSRDEEAAGDCLNCGPIYIPTVTDPGAELAAERPHNPKRQRQRGPFVSQEISEGQDGCDVAPKCLECPLAECRYVTNECSCGATFAEENRLAGHRLHCQRDISIAQAYAEGATIDALAARFSVHRRSVYRAIGRTAPMNDDPKAIMAAPMRILSTDALGQQCIQSLRELESRLAIASSAVAAIRTEALKLVKIAELTGTEVPPTLLAMATGKAPKTADTKKPYNAWRCPACSTEVSPPAGRSIGKHKAECQPYQNSLRTGVFAD